MVTYKSWPDPTNYKTDFNSTNIINRITYKTTADFTKKKLFELWITNPNWMFVHRAYLYRFPNVIWYKLRSFRPYCMSVYMSKFSWMVVCFQQEEKKFYTISNKNTIDFFFIQHVQHIHLYVIWIFMCEYS